MFAESDSEGGCSPVKRKSRVAYCKTYEEIRLEEIQAESAAFYSYKPDDYLGCSGGGKYKRTTTTTAIRNQPIYFKDRANSSDSVDLNFKVLTLEEIRRRKIDAINFDKAKNLVSEDQSTEEFLKDAMKTLEKLKAINKERRETNKRKYSELDDFEQVSRKKLSKIVDSKVPPVRLKRSLKFSESASDNEKIERNLEGEIESNFRKNDEKIQIRICDSSTADDLSNESVEKISVSTETNDCDNLQKNCNSAFVEEDDILKDIEALL